jgi:NOL1/NOP2/sun family putative RNA methylase
LNLPVSFIASVKDSPGFNEESFLRVHESGEQITSIRINPAKFSVENFPQNFQDNIAGKIPWTSNGYYLQQRPSFTLDPLFHAGAYYVQEASSMFVEEAIRQTCDLDKALRVLDLCAAPGGKSTLLQSLISADSLLVSNEVIKSRANILTDNITRWGAANVVVTNNDPKDFDRLPSFFDVMVVDAPCSGSGLFRKDPAAITEWSLNNVALCSQRQQRILADALPSLKPGGVLIYSTCSYSMEEDEAIMDWLLQHHPLTSLPLQLTADWQIKETVSAEKGGFGYRFYPDKLKGEGFFLAAFQMQGELKTEPLPSIKNKPVLPSKAEMETLAPFILQPEKYGFIKWQEEILALPANQLYALRVLQKNLYLKKAGVQLGTVIRNDFIPGHQWALSTLASDAVPSVPVELDDALQYLRRNDMKIDSGVKGWAIIVYRDLTLGLAKILPGRINNYYPKEWRILNK